MCNGGMRLLPIVLCVILLSGCAGLQPATLPLSSEAESNPEDLPPVVCPADAPLAGAAVTPGAAMPVRPRGKFVAAKFSGLPHWARSFDTQSWTAFLESCTVLGKQADWRSICADAALVPPHPVHTALQSFFETHFQLWLVVNGDGSNTGLITGYYEPLLHGSPVPTPQYRYAVYAPPNDLLTVDLGDLFPELKGRRVRGRLQGNRVVPYFTRAEIEVENAPLKGQELAWVDNPVDLFFLQIQGSGRIVFNDGSEIRVGYADQNGHPFRSIGRLLMQRGDLSPGQVTLQGIKAWAEAHPDQVTELLDANPSYVFFRQLPNTLSGPLGALGVPLTAGASIAVDPRVIPLGAPVFLDTTQPNSRVPLRRLVMAQDTGGAINGAVRADFFWGYGKDMEQKAGTMKQAGRMWLLYPRGLTPPEPR